MFWLDCVESELHSLAESSEAGMASVSEATWQEAAMALVAPHQHPPHTAHRLIAFVEQRAPLFCCKTPLLPDPTVLLVCLCLAATFIIGAMCAVGMQKE